jgi:hypothetical protein
MYDSTLNPPQVPLPQLPGDQKQSPIGIASFVISILALLLVCVAIIVAFSYGISVGLNNPYNPQVDTSSPVIIGVAVLICLSPLLSLVGVGLGIGAVVQKTQKKTFGIIGLILNGLILVAICVLYLIGVLGRSG